MSDMSKSQISDRDIERFLSGLEPENEVLAELMPRLHNWHARHTGTPSDDKVKAFAVEASQTALASRPEHTTTAATREPSGRRLARRLSYQLGVGLAALVLVTGMTGVAVASNEAAPGDALYGVDRALEAIGINDGAAAERIAEAQVLLDRGQAADAVAHAAEAISTEEGVEGSEAAAALLEVAEKMRTTENGSANAQAVHARVAGMLTWMADAKDKDGPKGKAFGEHVSNMARGISEAPIASDTSVTQLDSPEAKKHGLKTQSQKGEKANNGAKDEKGGNGNGNGSGNGNGPPTTKPGKGRP